MLRGRPFFGDRPFHWQEVGIADPADGLGVFAVTECELRWTPAGDWPADELLRGDNCAKRDEDDDGVLSVHTVDIVVVHADDVDVADRQDRLENALHVAL